MGSTCAGYVLMIQDISVDEDMLRGIDQPLHVTLGEGFSVISSMLLYLGVFGCGI